MALFNEIGVGRYNRFLQKFFNMKGNPPVRQLTTDMAPVLPLFLGNEGRYLEGWNEYGVGFTTSSVAGQFGMQQLRNPPGSNVVAIVKRVGFSEGLGDIIDLSFTNLAAADLAITTVNSMDTRVKKVSTVVFSSGTQAAAPSFGYSANSTVIARVQIGANGFFDFLSDSVQEVVLMPGVTLRAAAQTVNQNINVCWQWRERAIEESELLSQ